MAKVLIADDHPLFRDALIGALQPLLSNITIIQADTLNSTLQALENNTDCDLVLLDLNMPDCDNFYGLIRVTQDYPSVPVAVVSGNDSESVISKVMNLGAKGFISKSTPTTKIVEALRHIISGGIWLPEGTSTKINLDTPTNDLAKKVGELTPKQFQVLKLLQSGLLNKQIAYDLSITEATVKAHIGAIFRKLAVNTRTQAVLLLNDLNIN